MNRIVAVVNIGPTIFAKLDLERDRLSASRTQAPDILSDQPFVRRDRVASPVDGDAFPEVEMDRMVPTRAAIDIGPVLARLGWAASLRHAQ